MSKRSDKVPTLGQPVFVISENALEDRITIAGERGLLNNLVYFAVDGIIVKKQEYLDKEMTKIIINEKMYTEEEGGEKKSLELHMDLEKNFSGEPNLTTIFVDEEVAQATAKKMNENQKKQCRKLLDLASKAYNEYDNIIALSVAKPSIGDK